jgi:hypothetical protein
MKLLSLKPSKSIETWPEKSAGENAARISAMSRNFREHERIIDFLRH